MTELQDIRETARKNGEKMFILSTPCRHGHYSERFVSTGGCCECIKLAVKPKTDEQRLAHNEYYKELRANRGEDHTTYMREYMKARRGGA